jgi:hypothetical protein
LWGKGAFGSLCGLTGQGAKATAMVAVVVREVGVVDGAVVPIIGVPLQAYAIGVMTIDVWSQAPTTPVSHT